MSQYNPKGFITRPVPSGSTLVCGDRVLLNASGAVVPAGADSPGIGVVFTIDRSERHEATIQLFTEGTVNVNVHEGSDPVLPNAPIYAAANGKVTSTPGAVQLGYPLEAGDAEDEIEAFIHPVATGTVSTPISIASVTGLQDALNDKLEMEDLPIATDSTPGIVSAGEGLSVDGAGVLSVN